MTETIEPMTTSLDEKKLAEELVERARADGVGLVGADGLLTGLTKSGLETALDWDEIAKDLRPVYTAISAEMAEVRFGEFAEKWGQRYPAIIKLWRSAWPEFIPFLDYDVEIRRIICSTNAIESLNARYRRAARARGHFPTELAALKCLYLLTRSLDPTGRGKARWAMRWKPALNAFAITFEGRIVPSSTN
jgi:putative transposase